MKTERYLQALLVKGGSVAALYLSQVFLARSALTLDEFGRFSYLVSVLNIASFICLWGVDKYLVREVAVHHDAGESAPAWAEIRRAGRVATLNAILGTVPLVLYLEWARPEQMDRGLLLVAALALVVIVLARSSAATMRGFHRVVSAEAALNLVRPLVLIASIAAAWAWRGKLEAPWLVAGMAVSFLVVDLALRGAHRRVFPPPAGARDRLPLGKLYRDCAPYLLIGVGLPLLSNLDVVLLGNLGEDQDVARYAACARVINLAIVGLVSVNLLIAPKLPVLYQQGKHAEMQALLRRNNVVVALVSLLPALALLFFGGWILASFGEEYGSASDVLHILLIGQMINVCVGPVNLICMMAHRQRAASRLVLVACAIEAALCYFLIPSHGAMGAAWANAGALGFLNISLAVVVAVELKLDPTLLNLLPRRQA
ncbi:MAG: hypothetical protein CMJ94_13445 [Planctomycetes bacterium]|nr:hypothetical protein [Planctomycetota bacterium]